MKNRKAELIQEFMDTMFKMRKFFSKTSSSALSKTKLTRLQLQAMHIMFEMPDITVGELGDHLVMSSAAVAQLVERLEKLGLIKRKNDDDDKRVVRVILTDMGQKEFRQIKTTFMSKMSKILSNLPEKDIVDMIRIYKKLIRELETMHEDLS